MSAGGVNATGAAQGVTSLGVSQPAATQQALLAPNIQLVNVAPQPTDQSPTAPKKAVPNFTEPRDPEVHGSLTQSTAVNDAASGLVNGGQNAAKQGASGAESLPQAQGLVAVYPNTNGGTAYLTAERWAHIKQNHVTSPPTARGKRTTTWWPVLHTANGAQSR